MRILRLTAILFVIMSCGQREMTNKVHQVVELVNPSNMTDPDSIRLYLLESAAADFHQHQKPAPVNFKEIHFGSKPTEQGKPQYLLCGQFAILKDNGDTNWHAFTTIKTSGYEQYLGGTYCNDSTIVWNDTDLTSELMKLFRN